MTATPTSSDSDKATTSGRDLASAIVIAVALAVGFIWSLVAGPTAVTLLIGAIVAFGVVEASAVLRRQGIAPIVVVLLATTGVTMYATLRADHLGQAVGMLVLVLGSGLWLLVDPNRSRIMTRMGATVLLGLWLPFLASFAILLAATDDGPFVLFLVIAATAMSDVAAYAVGSMFGRHKVAPRLSPNKSVEGLVGGITVAGLTSFVLAAWVFPALGDPTTLTAGSGLVIGLACALAGFGGDLFESMIKRDLGIKDLGALLPGHGGILDRFDAILAALPVGWLLVVAW